MIDNFLCSPFCCCRRFDDNADARQNFWVQLFCFIF